MTEKSSKDIDKLSYLSNMYMKKKNMTCLDTSYKKMIKDYKRATWNSTSEIIVGRLYLWQLCTEYFWFQTSVTRKDLFGNTMRNE